MKKYKNISDFRQLIVIDNKRIFLNPGEIVESEKDLKYIFLSEVFDSSDNHQTITQNQEKNKHNHSTEIEKTSIPKDDTFLQYILHFVHNQQQFNDIIQKEIEILKNSVLTIQKDIYDISLSSEDLQMNQQNNQQNVKLKKDIRDKLEFFVIEDDDNES